MRKEEKTIIIENLTQKLGQYPNFYITDTQGLNAAQTAELRRMCFEKQVEMIVAKNTLMVKALEATNKAEAELVEVLNGPTAIMFSETANLPARLITEFRKTVKNKNNKPAFKGAYVQECVYVGEQNLEALTTIKSREELIGDIIGLLQSPMKNVVSALTAGAGGKVAGLVKALEER